ncbi:adenylosuccinate lyase, putative [Theileria equi strain WA]|uniref:Adenylosuccinate lyase, putative n=1 Tax=Theileria equi strain WA TaxID=1537102 RepID=L1LCV1_THEEQ|nr:adenylosuccinate lyase, putative [Theileria equi strain WA]EKX73171.1 adenylosuccinate lyase, putative [Theileria equi strain WA]|eukprot:XP_004832623.1 adenylosuccinate lyase, putative [Theileria equi strain WA]
MSSKYGALSPLDSVYKRHTSEIPRYLSNYALTSNRILVEVRWVQHLVKLGITPVKELSREVNEFLDSLKDISEDGMRIIEELNSVTRHDVKAVEYYIRKRFEESGYDDLILLMPWIHMFCTSEDINSPAHSTGIRDCMDHLIKPLMLNIINSLAKLSVEHASKPMLSRTHGQPASPTTFGKEMAIYTYRLSQQYKKYIDKIEYFGKFGGAVGNFNVHFVAFPDLDWPSIAKSFVEDLNLTYQPYSTQIECHDYISELSDSIARFNTILKDMCVDMWLYLSHDLLKLKNVKGEVGSSTMPHKINPIHFECAEGNIGLANSLFSFFSSKLPTSRMQRDLSDSTVLRNIGTAMGYSVVAYKSIITAFERVDFNAEKALQELENNYAVLSEPTQVVLKMMGRSDAFDAVLKFTRGSEVNGEEMKKFIQENCQLSPGMSGITPASFTGCAEQFARNIISFLPNK